MIIIKLFKNHRKKKERILSDVNEPVNVRDLVRHGKSLFIFSETTKSGKRMINEAKKYLKDKNVVYCDTDSVLYKSSDNVDTIKYFDLDSLYYKPKTKYKSFYFEKWEESEKNIKRLQKKINLYAWRLVDLRERFKKLYGTNYIETFLKYTLNESYGRFRISFDFQEGKKYLRRVKTIVNELHYSLKQLKKRIHIKKDGINNNNNEMSSKMDELGIKINKKLFKNK